MLGLTRPLSLNLTKSLVRFRHHGGTPGTTIPIRMGDNKYYVTGLFIVFFGSGFAAPFWVCRHQLLKKNQ